MLPTAMSLFATLCSASTMLGIPVEIYSCKSFSELSGENFDSILDGTVYMYFGMNNSTVLASCNVRLSLHFFSSGMVPCYFSN